MCINKRGHPAGLWTQPRILLLKQERAHDRGQGKTRDLEWPVPHGKATEKGPRVKGL